ncbi:hypothetical protein Sps_04841 [Shewanella psychrophila]|uniref:Uncharacterized protein n=1 Tax=Shewanella psychrophila TaxID=225848 RepID=A0A1S6HWK1_9GAMM|nr:hypothetical protein Sps_04841 [Shewanella psychrophila]
MPKGEFQLIKKLLGSLILFSGKVAVNTVTPNILKLIDWNYLNDIKTYK